jgi:hypothetical protein
VDGFVDGLQDRGGAVGFLDKAGEGLPEETLGNVFAIKAAGEDDVDVSTMAGVAARPRALRRLRKRYTRV